MARKIVLPRRQPGEDIDSYLNNLVRTLEQMLNIGPAGRRYSVTTPVVLHTIDATTGTLAQALAVLGTMITDLQAGGRLP